MAKSKKIWVPIEGYEGLYEVSNKGDIRSLDRTAGYRGGGVKNIKGVNMRLSYNSDGYYQVGLFKDGKGKTHGVSRVVAKAFIPNPDNLPQVNHINEIKTDNRVENLEWCTGQSNSEHSNAKKWVFISPDGERVEILNLARFCRENGLNRSNMHKVYLGKYKSSEGWTKG